MLDGKLEIEPFDPLDLLKWHLERLLLPGSVLLWVSAILILIAVALLFSKKSSELSFHFIISSWFVLIASLIFMYPKTFNHIGTFNEYTWLIKQFDFHVDYLFPSFVRQFLATSIWGILHRSESMAHLRWIFVGFSIAVLDLYFLTNLPSILNIL